MDLPFYLLLNYYVSGKRHSFLQRDGKNPYEGFHLRSYKLQWRISGRPPPPLLFLDQTEVRRPGKKFSVTPPPPLPLKVWIRY